MTLSKSAVFITRVYPNSLVFQRDCVQRDPDSFLLFDGEWQGVDEFSLTCREH